MPRKSGPSQVTKLSFDDLKRHDNGGFKKDVDYKETERTEIDSSRSMTPRIKEPISYSQTTTVTTVSALKLQEPAGEAEAETEDDDDVQEVEISARPKYQKVKLAESTRRFSPRFLDADSRRKQRQSSYTFANAVKLVIAAAILGSLPALDSYLRENADTFHQGLGLPSWAPTAMMASMMVLLLPVLDGKNVAMPASLSVFFVSPYGTDFYLSFGERLMLLGGLVSMAALVYDAFGPVNHQLNQVLITALLHTHYILLPLPVLSFLNRHASWWGVFKSALLSCLIFTTGCISCYVEFAGDPALVWIATLAKGTTATAFGLGYIHALYMIGKGEPLDENLVTHEVRARHAMMGMNIAFLFVVLLSDTLASQVFEASELDGWAKICATAFACATLLGR